jgi:hypothetical protein
MRKLALAVAALALLAQGPALAQARSEPGADAAADQVTAAENLKYVELSKAVDARNAAARQAYENALAAHAADVAKHAADVAAAEAAKAAVAEAYARAMADWEACKAGDRARCAK